ncbi:MAG: hypothetical protein M3467_03920 [Actinomycetota bacterium]|nr:hypothetical protein [Actinomycetota bacterium]
MTEDSTPASTTASITGRPTVTVSLSAQQTNKLAADLVRQLAGQIGDAEAIALTLRRWHEVLGAQRWGGVCMAAIRITFRDCLAPTPIADVPPGSVAFIEGNLP